MNKNQKNIKYLGLDWGEKRIGLALGDAETKLATPFGVVSNPQGVLDIIKAEGVETVIVGCPYNISDSNFPLSKKYEEFVKYLKDKLDIPVETIDERLSSKAADSLLGGRFKNKRDAVAAMLILQSYFDKI